MIYPRQFCELSREEKINRGKSFIDYYENGEPIKYCYGFTDKANDEPLECCKNCLDFYKGEYAENERLKRLKAKMESEDTE